MAGPQSEDLFPQALASLKRRGSNVLVVGADHDAAHIDACGRFLGEPHTERERVLVFTDSDERLDDRVPGVDPGRLHVVDVGNLTRGGAGVQGSPVPPGTVRVPAQDIEALQSAVLSELAVLETVGPAELRLCVDSLAPLVSDHGTESVLAFLEAVTEAVVDLHGMAHYHLPVGIDDPPVSTLAPAFDATVELRTDGPRTVHRWHIDDPDLTTEWLAL